MEVARAPGATRDAEVEELLREVAWLSRRRVELETEYSHVIAAPEGPETFARLEGLRLEAADVERREEIAKAKEKALINTPNVIHTDSTFAGLVGPVGRAYEPSPEVEDPNALPLIACCKCAAGTRPNASRLCLQCLSEEAKVCEGISDLNAVGWCKNCERFESKSGWLMCEWESQELLALLVKKIKKPRDCNVVKAEFIWTEPHCRRIKVKIFCTKLFHECLMQDSKVVTFVQQAKQCEECTKSVTPHLWVANLQVRQRKSPHKRTLLHLEQLILKAQAHRDCVNIVDVPDGLDFHFSKPQHMASMLNFIRSHLCVKVHPIATQLVSHDAKSNTASNKFVQLVELPAICRDDLVFLSKEQCKTLGGISPLVLCQRIDTGVHLLDPFTLRGLDLDAERFWRLKLQPFLSRKHLVEFVVLDVAHLDLASVPRAATAPRFLTGMMETLEEKSTVRKAWGAPATLRLVEAEVALPEEVGNVDKHHRINSHLGATISAGAVVLGYDLAHTNMADGNDAITTAMERLPSDIILVKKQAPNAVRNWALRAFRASPAGAGTGKKGGRKEETRFTEDDVNAYKEDLERDAEMRKHVAIFRHPNTGVELDVSAIPLAEMLDDLTLDDQIL